MTAWLLTWLWQGGALTALVAVAIRWTPRRNAATTYLVWYATLVAVVWLGWSTSPGQHLANVVAAGPEPIYVPSAPRSVIATLVGAWTAVALIGLLRLLPALRNVFAIRDRCRPFPPSIESQLTLWLDERERGRRSELMICDGLRGAAVLGFHRPTIAIPSALVDALTIDELDQVILHEYAHVQRYDDWSRLAQTMLLSVLWIHPAALYASRALNREREMACDEWVVERTGRPKSYARCLAHAAEITSRIRENAMLEPALLGSRPELVRRVDRVLSIEKPQRHFSGPALSAALCAIVLCSVQLQSVGAFSEIADTVFPQVRAAAVWADIPNLPSVERVFPSRVARPNRVQVSAPVRVDEQWAETASAPVLEHSAVVPDAVISPDVVGRSFAGMYPLRETPPLEQTAPGGPAPWRTFAAPGIEIASAAKKTSVGIAGIFSRAGVSIARSF